MKKRNLVKLLLAAVLAALALQPAAVFAKDIIRVHEADWTGNAAMVKMVQIILEEEMGFKTKKIFLPAGPAVFQAILADEIDVSFEFWPSYSPEKATFISKWGGDGSVEYFGDVGYIGSSGWYVPRYVVEGDAERGIKAVAPDLKTWEDLNRYKEVFAQPETAPKGRLVATPIAAWQGEDAARVKGLGLDYVTVVLGSETAHWAELKGAFERGEPILIYMWAPHWTIAVYDMVEIGLPPHSDEAWPATDWPDERPYNFGNPSLKERHPEVHKMITSMSISASLYAEFVLDIDINEMEVEPAVRKWMAAHEDLWRSWLP